MSASETPRPLGPSVVGLDLSLTATGVARPDGTTLTLESQKLPKAASHELLRGRIEWVRGEVAQILGADRPDIVVVEGFSFASKGSSVDQIYGLGWTVRLLLHDLGLSYAVIPPTNVKKFATGRGGGVDKADMRMALFQRFGIDNRDDNQVDAFWLRAMALDHYGAPLIVMPAINREALAKVVWPELIDEAA